MVAGDGGFEPLNSNLPDSGIIATHGEDNHPLIAVGGKHPAPTCHQTLWAAALRAVAAAGEALVTLAQALEAPQGAQGPPWHHQQVPNAHTNGHRAQGVHHG